jgi:putative DNA-invertase from lambdoid prophage Rac
MNIAHNQCLSYELDFTMSRIAYYRTSTADQSIESQRTALGGPFDAEYKDEGISGGTIAASRPDFGRLLAYIRSGDTLFVYAVDRLGRDAIDVQTTVRDLLARGVSVHIHGLGPIGSGAGELILAVLAQVASMEKARINERTAAGRVTAQGLLAEGKLTQHGKASMGRPFEGKPEEVRSWKAANKASLSQTAKQFDLSLSTIKRYCAAASELI